MKKEKKQTLQRAMFWRVISLWIVMFTVFVICINVAIDLLKDEVMHREDVVVLSYVRNLEWDCARAETMAQSYAKDDIGGSDNLARTTEDMDTYLENVKAKLKDDIEHVSTVTGFFYYDVELDAYMTSENGTEDATLKKLVLEQVQNAGEVPENWFLVKEGNWYFLRIIKKEDIYVGTWVNLQMFIEEYFEWGSDYVTYLTFASGEDIQSSDERINSISNILNRQEVTIDGVKYIIAKARFMDDDCTMCSFTTQDKVFSRYWTMKHVLYVFVLVLAAIVTMNIMGLYKRTLAPIRRLTDGMKHLRKGEIDTHIEVKSNITELEEMEQLFNEMTDEIKTLKIEAYEEQLKRQEVQLLQLQSQLKPHFIVNCLNVMRGLAMKKETDKIEELTMNLSSYLRGTLEVEALVTVEQEMKYVRNYIEIQKMRYSDHLVLVEDIDAEAWKEKIPAMFIQIFVENAVKHELETDGNLEVKVTVRKEGQTLRLLIEDDGEGYAPEILDKLSNMERIVDETGEHLGIYNVCQRLMILYKEGESIRFFNKETGGAAVEICIPLDKE